MRILKLEVMALSQNYTRVRVMGHAGAMGMLQAILQVILQGAWPLGGSFVPGSSFLVLRVLRALGSLGSGRSLRGLRLPRLSRGLS
jgi:hypothetical protein